MCRIAVYSGGLDKAWLSDTLTYLENRLGGDGNGFYCPTTNELIRGTGLQTDDIAMMSADLGGAFHTRLTSIGRTLSALNHPFPLRNKARGVLIHNGTWREYDRWYISDSAGSDTATAAELVSENGIGCLLSDYFKGSGVWVNVTPDFQIVVIKRSGTIGMAKLGKKALASVDEGWMLVSERPKLGASEYKAFNDDKVYVINGKTGSYGLATGIEKILLTPDREPTKVYGSNWSGWRNYSNSDFTSKGSGDTFEDDSFEGLSAQRQLNRNNASVTPNYSGANALMNFCELCGEYEYCSYQPVPTVTGMSTVVKRVCKPCKTWEDEWVSLKSKNSDFYELPYTTPLVD